MGTVENPEHPTQRDQQSNHCNQGLNTDARQLDAADRDQPTEDGYYQT
jgi:hypothetical protein